MPYDYWFKPTKAIQAKDGIKAQSQTRGIRKELVGAEMDRSARTTDGFWPPLTRAKLCAQGSGAFD